MQHIHQRDSLDAARQSQLYSHLDHPKHALTLTCLDACNLQLMSSSGGLRLFRHRRRPTVLVRLMGRVIGIEEKEKKVTWLVDDGSAVIAVHHVFRQPASTPLSNDIVRPSRKGKERQIDGGIPSEYLLPPPPPLPSTSEKRKQFPKALINVSNVFEIGELVSVVGRVELWIDRRERVLFVDNVVRGEDSSSLDVQGHEGSIRLITDCNEEPRHMLSALHLSATEYSEPYHLPHIAAKETNWAPIELREITSSFSRPHRAQDSDVNRGAHNPSARLLKASAGPRCLRIAEESRQSLRVMEDVSELTNNGLTRKRTLGVKRRPMPEENGQSPIQVLSDKAKETMVRVGKGSADPPSSLLSIVSASPTSGPRQRQLRQYTKLSDSKMTDSTFRVYVEKHIVDYCSGYVTVPFSSSPDATPKAATRRSARNYTESHMGPPAFTLHYLLQVPDLLGHAQRTVDVLVRRREEKKRRKLGTSTKAAEIVRSTEKASDKMQRLYASVIQAMLMDGIIVLALPTVKIRPPFDGKRQRSDLNSQEHTPNRFRKGSLREDAYQVVTPALLSDAVIDVLERSTYSNTNLNSAQIVQKMQAADDRWRFIRMESVQECMQLLLPHHRHKDDM